MQALWVAKTGLDAQQTKLRVISNNLANVNTTGFKKSRAIFADLLYQNVRQAGGQSTQETTFPSGFYLGTGVRTVASEKIHTQGNIQLTENSLDIAIDGSGYLQILQPDGTTAYTRDGSLKVNQEGQLVTASGLQLQPAITIPADTKTLTIGRDGTVSVVVQGSPNSNQVGSIQLADFINPTGLEPVGENLFVETTASGTPQVGTPGQNGLGDIFQGMLETSNVNTAEELVSMIETQRAYEMNSKAIAAADEMMQFVNQTL